METMSIAALIGDDVETVERCALCTGQDSRADERFKKLLGLERPYDVQRCTACGLRWLSPRPTAVGYEKLYAYGNYFEGPAAVRPYSEIARERRGYFVKRILNIEALKPGGALSILDVGSATGEFVSEALARDHRAVGIELSDGARKAARDKYGVELIAERLEDHAGKDLYDVVHLNHVLEHLPQPATALDACHRLLRPGGLLVLEVPQQIDNDVERVKRLLGLKPTSFDLNSLHHTYFFDRSTLTRMVEQRGFEIRRLTTANLDATPLRPLRARVFLLRCFLWLADRIHAGGNIVEVFAVKP